MDHVLPYEKTFPVNFFIIKPTDAVISQIWEITASVGFIIKKFVTMHGHMNVNLPAKVLLFSPSHICLFVCFPGVTTHCGCIFTAR
jgi:hypothetical protein